MKIKTIATVWIAILVVWWISFYYISSTHTPFEWWHMMNVNMWQVQNNSKSLDLSSGFVNDAKEMEVVTLKDGDTYDITVTKVLKEIWNAKLPMLAYNGSIPGPVIKVEKWATVTVKFTNNVEDLETTMHSHGLRLENKFDGVPESMGWKQKPVWYGEVFEYTLTFPDEGIYWYHPHIREDLQQELGLYGNFLVEPTTEDYWNKVNGEETLILDDILLDGDKLESLSNQFANYVIMGRFWNTMMINSDTNYKLQVNQWDVKRFYLTNVANTRPFNFQIPWAKIKLVWWDLWKYERESFIDSLIIGPAERYIIEVYFPENWEYKIINKTPEKEYLLWTVNVSRSVSNEYVYEFMNLRTNEDTIKDIDSFRKYFWKEIDKELIMTIEMPHDMMNMWWWMVWGMNMWTTNNHWWIEREDNMVVMNKNSSSEFIKRMLADKETGEWNMDIDWKFKVWDKVKVRIFNDPQSMHPMQHPIHFHGQRFLVIDRNGESQINLVWKDTVLIPAGEYVDILLDITNPGQRMAHCHIAEHLSAWMMMNFIVDEIPK